VWKLWLKATECISTPFRVSMTDYSEMSWREIVDELEPCRDCSNRGRMWILKCDKACQSLKRWIDIRKVVKQKDGA